MVVLVMNKTSIAQHAKTSSSLLSPVQGLLQRKCACGNHTVAGGECSECAKKKSGFQRKLSIGASNDPLEREADRVADQVMSNRFISPSSSSLASGILQREDAHKEKTNEEKYKEGLEKLGEAFLKTPLGKELIEKLKQDALVKGATQLGKDFISTLPGKIITGAAATGAVATLAATHKELPAQIPEIPLDFVVPGLSVNLTYKGPVDKPTEAMITFKFTEQKSSNNSGKKPVSASEQYRAKTARLADEQAKFRANMRYKPGSPEDIKQREEDEALQNAALKYRGGIDIDAIIKQSSGLATPEPKNGLQLTMRKPSFGSQSPSLFGDEFKLKLPEEQKKKDAPLIQKKLRIGASNDPLELEADRIADQVLSESAVSDISHSVPGINRYTAQSPEHSEAVPASVGQVLASSGRPLESSLKQDMEAGFGYDFSNVRVHIGAFAEQSAKDVNANAYTVGHNIVFGTGQFSPETLLGRRLIAHELTHVVQQSAAIQIQNDGQVNKCISSRTIANANIQLIQREPKKDKKVSDYYRFKVLIPSDYTTVEQMYRLFERVAYGRETNSKWRCNDYCDMDKNRGKIIEFDATKSEVEKLTDPALQKNQETNKKKYEQLPSKKKLEVTAEVDKRYSASTGDKPGTKINKKTEEGKARQWDQILDEVMKEKENLEKQPPEIKQLMGGEGNFKPENYPQLQRIAEKLKQFGPEDFAAYKLLAIKATDKIDLFEKSVDMYLARKAELKKALEEEQKKTQDDKTKEPTMQDAINEQWQGVDESGIGNMSEADRYKLAQQKANDVTQAQLKYMKDHPGETLKDFAKSANPVMTAGDTFSGIGKDLTEVANGDANSWARWAAGTGAGAKLSGWLLAVAGVLYVASWLTGVGEVATIAAAAGYLLGATLVLSAAEHDLRIKAASQAKDPKEFKRNVELAAAAQTNVIVGVALIVVAAVLHFTAKAFFPETMQKLKVSLKNFRERIRLKGSVFELKPEIVKEMGVRKAELVKATELAKQKALSTATELEGLSTEQFVEKLEKGDGFLDKSKVSPDQKINFRELLKTPEGRSAIEGYKQKLVNALKTDVIAEIDKLSQEYGSKIDEFLKDVDAAKNHDDLNAALDKIEGTLTEEHAKKFMAEEQEKIVQKKLETAGDELKSEAAKAEAKANAEAKAKAEELNAEQWLDDLGKSLSEAGKKKLDAIRKHQKTAKDARELVQNKGGQDFLEGKTEPPKIVSDPQKLAAFKDLENDPNFLNRPAVKQAVTISNEAKASEVVRSELASEIALRRVRTTYAAKPGTNIYESVKVLREQPGYKTIADYKAANPKYRGPVIEMGGKIYKPVTDIDLLVTEKSGTQPETIKHMEEVKSGGGDTPGEAKSQLDTAQETLNALAKGDPQVRLILADGTDVTSRFDASSASSAKVVTTGPKGSKTGWTESLGVTADDLLTIAKEILTKLKGTK